MRRREAWSRGRRPRGGSGSPSNVRVPADGATRPTTTFASVDLPLPLSPTSPSVPPAGTASETPSSARNPARAPNPSTPFAAPNVTLRPSTASTGSCVRSRAPPSPNSHSLAWLPDAPSTCQGPSAPALPPALPPTPPPTPPSTDAPVASAVPVASASTDSTMPRKRSSRTSSRGTAAIRARVYSSVGRPSTSAVGPDSTTRPRRSTTTRSVTAAMVPMSCVISTTPTRRSSTSRRISARICWRMAASSAVVGSSAMTSSGSVHSASAITTRCRMPPENWCGCSSMRVPGSSIPVSASSSIAFARAARSPSPECSRIVSTSCSPTVMSGFRLVCGSWKIIEMRPPRSA